MGFWERLFGKTVAPSAPVQIEHAENPKFTEIGNTEPVCPYCNHRFDKMPQRKKECPNCKKPIYCRTRPKDSKKVLLKEDQISELEAQLELRHLLSLIKRYINTPRQQASYNKAKTELAVQFGKEPSENDVFWKFLNDELQYYALRDDWGLYSNVISQQAQLLEGEGKLRQALTFNLWLCYLDMNGPNNLGELGRTPGIKRFDPQGWPLIVDPIIKINGSLNLSKEEMKTLFFDHNQKIHDSLRLPISTKKAWDLIEGEIYSDRNRDTRKFL